MERRRYAPGATEPKRLGLLLLSWLFYGIAGLLAMLTFGVMGALTEPRIWSLAQNSASNEPMRLWWTLVGFVVIAPTFTYVFASAGRRVAQRRLDLEAEDLLSVVVGDVDEGAPPTPFFFYVRPFATTGALSFDKIPGPNHLGFFGSRAFDQHDRDFEYQLRRAVRRFGLVVGLGAPGEHVGVGRIRTTEETWRDLAATLMDRSSAIFCVPGPQPGTLWEMDRILASPRLIGKTVFFYPPTFDGAYAEVWAATVDALSEMGRAFPHAPAEPCAFTLSPARADAPEAYRCEPIGDGAAEDLRRCAALVSPVFRV